MPACIGKLSLIICCSLEITNYRSLSAGDTVDLARGHGPFCPLWLLSYTYIGPHRGVSVAQRLGHWTTDLAVMGSIPGPGVISGTSVTSAFHPSGVGKSSTSLHRLGLRRGAFACVWWQVTLCVPNPIWQATS